jgi:hypothetical protein
MITTTSILRVNAIILLPMFLALARASSRFDERRHYPVASETPKDSIVLRLSTVGGAEFVVYTHNGGVVLIRGSEQSHQLILHWANSDRDGVQVGLCSVAPLPGRGRTNEPGVLTTTRTIQLNRSTPFTLSLATAVKIELVDGGTSSLSSDRKRQSKLPMPNRVTNHSYQVSGGYASEGSSGSQCCLTCSGITVCGCSVSGSCGSCCVGSCC